MPEKRESPGKKKRKKKKNLWGRPKGTKKIHTYGDLRENTRKSPSNQGGMKRKETQKALLPQKRRTREKKSITRPTEKANMGRRNPPKNLLKNQGFGEEFSRKCRGT